MNSKHPFSSTNAHKHARTHVNREDEDHNYIRIERRSFHHADDSILRGRGWRTTIIVWWAKNTSVLCTLLPRFAGICSGGLAPCTASTPWLTRYVRPHSGSSSVRSKHRSHIIERMGEKKKTQKIRSKLMFTEHIGRRVKMERPMCFECRQRAHGMESAHTAAQKARDIQSAAVQSVKETEKIVQTPRS